MVLTMILLFLKFKMKGNLRKHIRHISIPSAKMAKANPIF